MKYIIFGCGVTGRKALDFLGELRVLCFTDNNNANIEVLGKKVITYPDMLNIYEEDKTIVIVIASENYWLEMEQQVCNSRIERYFVFHESDINQIHEKLPYYYLYKRKIELHYVQVLSRWHISQYKNILIYGVNEFLQYLLVEILEQNKEAQISIVPQDGYDKKIYSLGYSVIVLKDGLKRKLNEFDCVILNVKRSENDIRNKMLDKSNGVALLDIYDMSNAEPSFYYPELKRYKNIHKKKRIFIIGNGPSLRVSDLDMLYRYGEICIAFNKIYKIYDKTKWRAKYIGFSDYDVIESCMIDIPQIPGEVFVADSDYLGRYCYIKGVQYYHEIYEDFYPNYPGFSESFEKGFYVGLTVVYDIGIQLAAYMGAEEIFLLGVDNSIIGNLTDRCNHFIPDYYKEEEKKIFEGVKFEKEKIIKSYEKAELYSRQHGFRIFNATRGGKLEVFERVDFDSLFGDE